MKIEAGCDTDGSVRDARPAAAARSRAGAVRLVRPLASALVIGMLSMGGWAVSGLLAGQGDPATHAGADAAAFSANCAGCHGAHAEGGFGPSLKDAAFHQKWEGKGGLLEQYIRTRMPPADAGALPADVYAAAYAFIRAQNGWSAQASGASVSPAHAETGEYAAGGLSDIVENKDPIYLAAVAKGKAALDRMAPVDDAMLRAPPAGDWLNWRRTDDGAAYSPLKAINSGNAGAMTLAWTLALPRGTNGITPLVHNGVMFVHSNGTVIAINAERGDTLWTFSRHAEVAALGPPVTQPRSMAMLGDNLYVPTVDNHMLALNAKTGALIWDHSIEESGGVLRLTGGPIIVHGKLIQGVSGCAGSKYAGGCFIVALEAATGAEIWRFNTIARPGKPDGDTWNGAPLDQRFGSSVWSSGTYDPQTNLVYFGTGQTYHITPLLAEREKGRDNRALYTDTTLALDADTGRLVWFYQHAKRDVWDLDWAFERTLLTLPTAEGPRRVVATMGKLGILDVLDAHTGKYVFSHDVGLQDLVVSIDPKTGEKTTDPAKDPDPAQAKTICPFPAGVRNWPGTAYDPDSGLLYVPIVDTCMKYSWKPGTDWDIAYSPIPRPGGNGKAGAVMAIDLKTRRQAWVVWRRAPEASAMLATAGGLVFEGSRDRWFRASDSSSGEILWQMRLDNPASASPITYTAENQQFVAVTTGGGGPQDVSRESITPEIEPTAAGTTLWVFRLPGANK